MSEARRRKPISEIRYPRAELAGLIPFVFVRDTRDAALSHDARFNHFAASPLCGLSFSLTGVGHIISNPEDFAKPHLCPTAPKTCFVGPHPKPIASWNPGDVQFLMIGMFPDAFKILTGIDPFMHKQAYIDVQDILDGELLTAVLKVQEPGSIEERLERFQDMIAPIWTDRRPRGASVSNRVSDWVKLAIMRAALSEKGKSIRAFERRMRNLFGVSKRELNAHAKAEDAFALAYAAQRDGRLDLATIANDAGFADQSHMGRLTKRVTGHSPEQLMRLIETDEAYWSYRLVGAHLQAEG